MRKWLSLVVMAVVLAGLIASCGRLEPVGTLRIVSDPAGAAILIDGKATGDITPADLLLAVGTHTIAVTRDGFLITPTSRTVNVPPGQRMQASFVLAELGELTITSTPDGAALILDGEDSGEVTPHTFMLVVGEHTVEVVLDGYVADGGEVVVDLAASGTPPIDFGLLAAGTLAVTSTPDGAAIFLDGADSDEVTPHTIALAVGGYAVHVEKSGYEIPAARDVTVSAGAESSADFELVTTGTLGSLAVTSTPAGAAILLDGADTGEITPHAFDDLLPGGYEVGVSRRNFQTPAAKQVTVEAAGDHAAAFALSPAKIVLIETVSAVNCVGCPAMHVQEVEVEAAGYGPDKVVSIQYSEGWLGPDPHYDANPGDNIARARILYWNSTPWGGAMPAMFIDGTLSRLDVPNYAQPAAVMMDSLDAHLSRQPGLAIDVTIDDIHAPTFTVSIDLVAVEEVTGSNASLHVCVIETPIVYDVPPGSEGETVFHWIMREFETLPGTPLPVSPAAPGHFEIDFTAADGWVSDHLAVIAFIQDDVTLAVLQAGISDTLHSGD